MKFMKLGSKADDFQADGKFIRCASSEVASDVIINVGETKFFLHKFPLMSKSNRLRTLLIDAGEDHPEEITMADFPGGPRAFEICAKFCYGMTVILNAYNVVSARCAAEYLEMTEDVDRGNLIFKIEVFFNSSIFRSWKDSIIVLQTTKSLLPWSEDLKIVGRCVDSIASKTSVDPANITWSYTYSKKLSGSERIVDDTKNYQDRIVHVPKDWWVEDICELEIEFYKRVIVAVRSQGRMDGEVIGEALKTYALRWLPDTFKDEVFDDRTTWYKYLVETIISLLLSDKGDGCSCSFLLKLLKVAIVVGASNSQRENLVMIIGMKLEEASVKDLLIPARASLTTIYDVELIQSILNHYLAHEWGIRLTEEEMADFDLGRGRGNGFGSLVNITKLIDGYLAEVAHDPNLTVDSFVELSELIPKYARENHDGFYRAIDIYLKEHPSLPKAERKRLCGVMDVKRLSIVASMHAAQNERLPLRVVVQVMYFEQVKAAAGNQSVKRVSVDASNSVTSLNGKCENTTDECKSLAEHMSQMKEREEELKKNGKAVKRDSKLLPPRSRQIFDKLWAVGKSGRGSISSETSGTSQCRISMVPHDPKSSGSSSRQRRHSIS